MTWADDAARLASQPDYAATPALDRLRETEFARLDQAGLVYLDYTGGGLYAARQITRHAASLSGGIFGNPHSANSPQSK